MNGIQRSCVLSFFVFVFHADLLFAMQQDLNNNGAAPGGNKTNITQQQSQEAQLQKQQYQQSIQQQQFPVYAQPVYPQAMSQSQSYYLPTMGQQGTPTLPPTSAGMSPQVPFYSPDIFSQFMAFMQVMQAQQLHQQQPLSGQQFSQMAPRQLLPQEQETAIVTERLVAFFINQVLGTIVQYQKSEDYAHYVKDFVIPDEKPIYEQLQQLRQFMKKNIYGEVMLDFEGEALLAICLQKIKIVQDFYKVFSINLSKNLLQNHFCQGILSMFPNQEKTSRQNINAHLTDYKVVEKVLQEAHEQDNWSIVSIALVMLEQLAEQIIGGNFEHSLLFHVQKKEVTEEAASVIVKSFIERSL